MRVDDYFRPIKIDDPIASLRRDQERKAELDHERDLAALRRQSNALVWCGTSDELTATITKWYESGWIVARSLTDALRQAGNHFVRPDGTAVIVPAPLGTVTSASVVSRETFVKEILDSKGWSIFDWANDAEVSHATAIDYLHGKTKPHPSTRLKLAKSLGITIQQLPK